MITTCKVKGFKGLGITAVLSVYHKTKGAIQDGQSCIGPQGT